MNRIVIIGKKSFLGINFYNWIITNKINYDINLVGSRNSEWKLHDYSKVDVVIHVAAIVHSKKINEIVYEEINYELVKDVSNFVKNKGVKHFIFISTLAVFGVDSGYIDENTLEFPKSIYAKTKLKAENYLKSIESGNFKISIIRSPMIYGKGSKGNYKKLSNISKFLFIFPQSYNSRSIIYVKNLCKFIQIIIDQQLMGVFYPQNYDYVNTTQLVESIRSLKGQYTHKSRILGKINYNIFSITRKIFGNFQVSKMLYGGPMNFPYDYQVKSFKESIIETEL